MYQTSRDLTGFTGVGYDIGRPKVIQALWLTVSTTVFMRWWFPSRARVAVLRAFGASVGNQVLIRHRVRIHWPWKLSIGDASWIGEGTWILNLENVTIDRNVCVSQDVLLCTGSHDRKSATFEFDNGPIEIREGAWLAARATVLRGVTIGRNSTVGACALAYRDVDDYCTLLAKS